MKKFLNISHSNDIDIWLVTREVLHCSVLIKRNIWHYFTGFIYGYLVAANRMNRRKLHLNYLCTCEYMPWHTFSLTFRLPRAKPYYSYHRAKLYRLVSRQKMTPVLITYCFTHPANVLYLSIWVRLVIWHIWHTMRILTCWWTCSALCITGMERRLPCLIALGLLVGIFDSVRIW